jgi:predicted RNA-binding Zn ribbon-like protein
MTPVVGWPGAGDEELLIAVANTAHGGPDEFADASSVRTWWRSLGAPVPTRRNRPEPQDGAAMLRDLRAVIRELARRNNGIETTPDRSSTLDTLTLRLDLRAVPTLRADPAGDLGRDISAATVAALLRAMARPGWPRLKACRGDDCRWVYIDRSRNTSRRWCDMANCGNRAKLATFRARHRAGPR